MVAQFLQIWNDVTLFPEEKHQIHSYGYVALASKLQEKVAPQQMRTIILELRNADLAINETTEWFNYIFTKQILPVTEQNAIRFI